MNSLDKSHNLKFIKISIVTIGLILFLLPIAFYIYHFGVGLWNSHTDWALMGSALGGIYTPILAILTLAVLLKQLQIQTQVRNYEQREISRKIVFEMVEKLSKRINLICSEEQLEKLLILAELPKDNPEVQEFRSQLMDIFTLWTSVRAYIINYNKNEPRLSVDLLAIPVLYLNFNACYDIDKAYLTHISNDQSEPFLYRL